MDRAPELKDWLASSDLLLWIWERKGQCPGSLPLAQALPVWETNYNYTKEERHWPLRVELVLGLIEKPQALVHLTSLQERMQWAVSAWWSSFIDRGGTRSGGLGLSCQSCQASSGPEFNQTRKGRSEVTIHLLFSCLLRSPLHWSGLA